MFTLRRTSQLCFVIIALVFAVAGCAPQAATETPASVDPAETSATTTPQQRPAPRKGLRRPANSLELQAIRRLADIAASIRQLEFKQAVVVEIEDAEAISESLWSQVDTEELREVTLLYTALGLLPEDLDLVATLRTVLAEQVIGYYDTDHERLVVRQDIAANLRTLGISKQNEQAHMVLVHELVHALQAQHLDLGAAAEEKRDTDAANAFRSLIEGDATLSMIGWIAQTQNIPLNVVAARIQQLSPLVNAGALVSGEELAQAPAIIRHSLVAPYTKGMFYSAELYRRGGWALIDQAHRDVPRTTEEILHPDKQGEIPDPIDLKSIARNATAKYRVIHEDTLGELEMAVYLGLNTTQGIDESAAAGWNGDRLQLLERKRKRGLWWVSIWDSIEEAQEAQTAALRVSRGREHDSVVRSGRALLILRDLPHSLRDRLKHNFVRFARALPTVPKQRTTLASP